MTQALHEDQDDGYWVGHTSKKEALPRTGVGWAADVVSKPGQPSAHSEAISQYP